MIYTQTSSLAFHCSSTHDTKDGYVWHFNQSFKNVFLICVITVTSALSAVSILILPCNKSSVTTVAAHCQCQFFVIALFETFRLSSTLDDPLTIGLCLDYLAQTLLSSWGIGEISSNVAADNGVDEGLASQPAHFPLGVLTLSILAVLGSVADHSCHLVS
jgi:hypothetical protein